MRGRSKWRGDPWVTLSVLILAAWLVGAVTLLVMNWPA
jgi:hypothetical protein